ncbi:MAG: hypothetical protein KDB92_11645 [Chitinophagaceae bacterium]|nr:hypothetical protein [Chitinophagaceae bacterium]
MKNNTNKFLLIAVILLLLVNIALVLYMVLDKSKGNDHGRMGGKAAFEKFEKEMGMSATQKAEYDSLRTMHFDAIRPVFDSIRANRRALYKMIWDKELNDSLITVYSAKIAEGQTQADKMTINHFRRTRNLFEGDMLKEYD